MRRETCVQARGPAKCEAQVMALAAQRTQIREACMGKQGQELRTCIQEQRQKE